MERPCFIHSSLSTLPKQNQPILFKPLLKYFIILQPHKHIYKNNFISIFKNLKEYFEIPF